VEDWSELAGAKASGSVKGDASVPIRLQDMEKQVDCCEFSGIFDRIGYTYDNWSAKCMVLS
jgi:hypothetical protein